ncbi:MAG: DNA topoisomerase VI subunit B, partial [Candidatus Bathyarchaeia archaeon]
MSQIFQEISPADFFYRNREIAGFANPVRAIFSAIRELVENSLDASEPLGILPDIYIRLSFVNEKSENLYVLRIEDNGSGIPADFVPLAFCQFLFSSKYKLKQSRGTFGLGGTMTILYGQITTNKPVKVISSTGTSKIYEYTLMIDIERNRPVILDRRVRENENKWRGTIVEVYVEGDYYKAMPKILEYLRQTAIVNPYASITFVDPRGRLYKFERTVSVLPPQPRETLPHPHGIDVETMYRIIRVTSCKTLLDFMQKHFHRVGKRIAKNFLRFAGFPEDADPKKLKPEEIVNLVHAMKSFEEFL